MIRIILKMMTKYFMTTFQDLYCEICYVIFCNDFVRRMAIRFILRILPCEICYNKDVMMMMSRLSRAPPASSCTGWTRGTGAAATCGCSSPGHQTPATRARRCSTPALRWAGSIYFLCTYKYIFWLQIFFNLCSDKLFFLWSDKYFFCEMTNIFLWSDKYFYRPPLRSSLARVRSRTISTLTWRRRWRWPATGGTYRSRRLRGPSHARRRRWRRSKR